MSRVLGGMALGACTMALALASSAHAVVTYDDQVTSEMIFGTGNVNAGFTVDRANGVELALRGKVRFPAPQETYNSNGDGTYTFTAGIFGGTEHPQWNFDWSINTNYDGTGGNLDEYTFELAIDYDPGAGTHFLAWDHVSFPLAAVPHDPPSMQPGGFHDHAMGNNATPNGGGAQATDQASYAALLQNNHVAQNSWRLTFFDGPGFPFSANATGTYDVVLTAFKNGVEMAQVGIEILVDGFVTPDAIFGTGNANGGFTLARTSGVELGIRGKVRFPDPLNQFNSNFDGTYTFLAGVFGGVENPQWGFDWSVNTDYTGTTGKKLDDYTYLLEMDFDPGAGTSFLAWDHISFPVAPIPHDPPSMQPGGFYDHAMGNNATPNGGGVEAGSQAQYMSQLSTDNVAQNSWRYPFYDGPGFPFDANKIGRYDLRLTAFDGANVAATVGVQIKVVKALTCTMDSQCDDGLACNGAETCNLATNECEFGTEVVCDGPCETGACLEPSGTCEPVANGTVCSGDPDSCSLADTCQAGSCVEGGGGDPDGDAVCSADDNCPSAANPSQSDLDGDGDGDACDALDGAINVTQVRLRRNTSVNPARPSGMIRVAGDMIVNLPGGDVLDVTSGLALHVEDALNLDTSTLVTQPSWTGADCKTRLHPKTAVVRNVTCRSPDKNYTATFRAVNPISASQPQVYKFTMVLRRLAVSGPFAAPVDVTLTYGAVDRIGDISDCQSNTAGLACKEG
ncbi:MAG TPA: hypothetical protein VIS07_21350 [Candidatus Binatia bacterium]